MSLRDSEGRRVNNICHLPDFLHHTIYSFSSWLSSVSLNPARKIPNTSLLSIHLIQITLIDQFGFMSPPTLVLSPLLPVEKHFLKSSHPALPSSIMIVQRYLFVFKFQPCWSDIEMSNSNLLLARQHQLHVSHPSLSHSNLAQPAYYLLLALGLIYFKLQHLFRGNADSRNFCQSI